MTPPNYYGQLNLLNNFFNVKDLTYGAKGDGNTDDTAAIQAAINTCYAAGGGTVYFPTGIYVIAGNLQTNVGGINYNSQLYFPFARTQGRVALRLLGEIIPNFIQGYGIGNVLTPTSGVILKSTITGSGTKPSVVSGGLNTGGTQTDFNWTMPIIENIQTMVTVNGSSQVTVGGLNFRNVANTIIKDFTAFPYNLDLTTLAAPVTGVVGIEMPRMNCELINLVENCNVGGFDTGYLSGEHTSFKNVVAICCTNGYEFGANYHHSVANRISAFWCKNDIKFSGASYVNILGLQSEWASQSKWYDNVYTILDPSNYGHGEVHYHIVEAGVGSNDARFSKSGGANLQCLPIGFAAASSFTVTGKRNDATALTNLLTALAAKGIIIDSTTAS